MTFIKKLADPVTDQPPKNWFVQKWSDLDFWWYTHRPDWWRTASDFYWNHIRPIFVPQNRWATRVIPRTWSDKTGLIPNLLYAAIIDFVEEERCFEVTDWENDGAQTRRLAAELREVYNWAKTGRAEFEKRLSDSVKINLENDPFGEDANWDEYNRLSDELKQWDDRCLTWIVQNRGILWT